MNQKPNGWYDNCCDCSGKEATNKNNSEERIMELMARASEMRTAIAICKKNCLTEAVKLLENELDRAITIIHGYVDTLR